MEAKQPKLGRMYLCLNVKDLQASMEFYAKLGFSQVGGESDQGWAIMALENNQIHLFQGHIPRNLINFRGGNVERIAAHLKAQGLDLSQDAHIEGDGSWAAGLFDPDGNEIYFNTFKSEQIEGEF